MLANQPVETADPYRAHTPERAQRAAEHMNFAGTELEVDQENSPVIVVTGHRSVMAGK